MVSNVWCRLISWRIATNALGIWVLVDSNVVKTHYCRKHFIKSWQIDRGESIRHPKVHDHRHGFCRNSPLPDVAIRAKRSSVKSPCLLFTDRPHYFALIARSVLEIVCLVLLPVVPAIVEIGQTWQGLLKCASLIRVENSDWFVVNLDEVCKYLVRRGYRELGSTNVCTNRYLAGTKCRRAQFGNSGKQPRPCSSCLEALIEKRLLLWHRSQEQTGIFRGLGDLHLRRYKPAISFPAKSSDRLFDFDLPWSQDHICHHDSYKAKDHP